MREPLRDCYNAKVPHVLAQRLSGSGLRPTTAARKRSFMSLWTSLKAAVRIRSGQVAQVVERSPEKAGVGGSTPSLATIIPKDLMKIW